jgi:hypothetical protein
MEGEEIHVGACDMSAITEYTLYIYMSQHSRNSRAPQTLQSWPAYTLIPAATRRSPTRDRREEILSYF